MKIEMFSLNFNESDSNSNVSPLLPVIRNVLKAGYGIDTDYVDDETLQDILNKIESELVSNMRDFFAVGKTLKELAEKLNIS